MPRRTLGEKKKIKQSKRSGAIHPSNSAPFSSLPLCFSLAWSLLQHMSLIKSSLRHQLVNSRLQENQQRAHS